MFTRRCTLRALAVPHTQLIHVLTDLPLPIHPGNGTIDVKELKVALTALGQSPSEEEVFVMVSQVNIAGTRSHAHALSRQVTMFKYYVACTQFALLSEKFKAGDTL